MYYFGLMLSLAAIYMIAGLGATLSLKTRQINLAGKVGLRASIRRR